MFSDPAEHKIEEIVQSSKSQSVSPSAVHKKKPGTISKVTKKHATIDGINIIHTNPQ